MTFEKVIDRFAQVAAIVRQIECEDYRFEVACNGDLVIVSAWYLEHDVHGDPDCNPPDRQDTRRWIVEPHATEDDIVRTVLKLLLTSHEHRVREHFLYRGRRIFSPHQRVVDAMEAVSPGALDVLRKAHDLLDDMNADSRVVDMCRFCDAQGYDGDGLRHKEDCIIRRLRLFLAVK
jgi:hypothetical protein